MLHKKLFLRSFEKNLGSEHYKYLKKHFKKILTKNSEFDETGLVQ
jgi:hypothetical protein